MNVEEQTTTVGQESGCVLCGSFDAKLRFREEPFRVLDCRTCGLTYVTPRHAPDDLVERVYGPDYWLSTKPREHGYSDYRGDRALYKRTFERRWETIRELFEQPGRALDVGCAAGYFLEVLLENGWDALGVEPSPAIAESARMRLGDEHVLATSLEHVQLPAASFDLITLWDVLEHLPDPVGGLSCALRLLKPDGKLVLETQNIHSVLARVLGRRWHHFKHREHLAHFHPGTLKCALELAGLQLVDLGTKNAGKYVRGDFVVERSARIHAGLPALLRPLLGGSWTTYINLGDEMIAIAEGAR